MKTTTLTTLAALAAASALAQGTVTFCNININAGLNAPLYLYGGTRATGPNYWAALYAGPNPGSLTVVATTPFLSGAAAGYFQGGVVSIPSVRGGGVAYFLVDWWDSTLGGTAVGATEAQAVAYEMGGHGCVWGASNYGIPFPVVTGDPGATPPGLPTALVGLDFPYTPEPSPFALAALAVAVLLGLRRIKLRLCVPRGDR